MMARILVLACMVPLIATGNLPAAETDERINLAPNPSFQDAAQGAQGWHHVGAQAVGAGGLKIAKTDGHGDQRSLHVQIGSAGIVSGTESYSSYNAGEGIRRIDGEGGVRGARTVAYRMDRDIHSFNATAWVKAPADQAITLQVRWHSRFGRRRPLEHIHTEASNAPTATEQGWRKYEIVALRPDSAHQAQLAIVTGGHAPILIDDVRIEFVRRENALILVDQVGYETESQSKVALFQGSGVLRVKPKGYRVVNVATGERVHEGPWEPLGYHPEFDRTYWRADFSALTEPGSYVVETRLGREIAASEIFEIGDDLVMENAARLAYEFFTYQRCGTEVPGFYKACHLDDARMPDGTMRDLTGGWHDAGDYNKYNGYTPESMYSLILTYDRKKTFCDRYDRDGDGVADILDEAMWGGEFLLKCVDPKTLDFVGDVFSGYGYWGDPQDETDNKPGTGDERPVRNIRGNPAFLVAGFALIGKHAPNAERYRDMALRLYEKHGGGIRELVALHTMTGDDQYKSAARETATKALAAKDGGLSQFRALGDFAIAFPKDGMVTKIRELAKARWATLSEGSDSTFGLQRMRDRDGSPIYFMHYRKVNDWYVGGSREHLDAAYVGILLDRLGVPEGRALAENQLHWVFGLNPFSTSLMEGVGDRFLPNYHHRYNVLPGNPRGAVPGAVVNGITRAMPWVDRPWVDLNPVPTGEYQCNEPWLPHNNRMLFLMSVW